jgi:hypothetical protein
MSSLAFWWFFVTQLMALVFGLKAKKAGGLARLLV